MADYKAANVTKYDNGGSGDNYIADGYIKSVEKVWIDSFTATAIAIGSDDSIAIGVVPKNKKITEIIVHTPVMGGAATSKATIFLGSAATFLMTAANCYLGSMVADGDTGLTFDIGTATTLRLQGDKTATVTDKDVTIYMKLVQANRLDLVLTGGTIKTIIKYT